MLQVNFIMICIIHKSLILLKITNISLNRFLKIITNLHFFKTNDATIKEIQNLFRLKKNESNEKKNNKGY